MNFQGMWPRLGASDVGQFAADGECRRRQGQASHGLLQHPGQLQVRHGNYPAHLICNACKQ